MKMGVGIVAFILVTSSPLFAFDSSELFQWGSLYLNDLTPLIEKAPKLKKDVKERLSRIGKKPEDIICVGQRFPGAWKHLGGKRVAPYHCQIGGEVLEINAKVRLTGNNGKIFDEITRKAMKDAQNVSQTKITWKWTTETHIGN